MGDQLVIYQAFAAIAQVGIIGAAALASFATFKALDKIGITNASKGLINKGRQWGKQVADNSAWRRGRETRKATRQARKSRNFAGNSVRTRIAGGVGITPGQREARQAVLRQAERTVRHHEAEEAGIFAEELRRRGRTGDSELENIARTGHEPAERRAAMTLLAENGRVASLRRLQQGGVVNGRPVPAIANAEDQESLREVITGNAGRLYGRAPDLNPGNPAPFEGASASDLSSWHHSTINAALAQSQGDPGLRRQLQDAYQEAWNNENLRGNFTPDAIQALQNEFGALPINPAGAPAGGGPGVLNVPHGGGGAAQPIAVPQGVANPNPANAGQPIQQQGAAGGNINTGPGANTPPPPPAGGGATPPTSPPTTPAGP
ncbi:MAG TPA: hypothetical protein VFZ58_03150 [Candidatus Saccharimonadales bacterium]